jgi:hypothetical protein
MDHKVICCENGRWMELVHGHVLKWAMVLEVLISRVLLAKI